MEKIGKKQNRTTWKALLNKTFAYLGVNRLNPCSPLFTISTARISNSFEITKSSFIAIASSVLEDHSNSFVKLVRTLMSGVTGSGTKITSPVAISSECRKVFCDVTFEKITGGGNTYALYVYHPKAIVIVDKVMFCNIHLDQSYTTVYIRDSQSFSLLRSCFLTLSSESFTSYAISYANEDYNLEIFINQTAETNTGCGTTLANSICRCREKLCYISNNISHVDITYYHCGITFGPIPEDNHHITMSQVLESKTGSFFYLYYLTHPISASCINFIDNHPVSPFGCFGNDRANNAVLEKCNFCMREASIWFGSVYADKCKYALVDCALTGPVPPPHSYVETTSLQIVQTLSTFRIKMIDEGVCRGSTKRFSVQTTHHIFLITYFVLLLLV